MLNFEIFAETVKKLNEIDLGGEVLTFVLYKKIFEINSDIYLVNGYGLTEAAISCNPDNITIGMPNANVNIATIDPEGRLQLPDSLGEMVIIGRGYINRDELTKNNFIKLLMFLLKINEKEIKGIKIKSPLEFNIN